MLQETAMIKPPLPKSALHDTYETKQNHIDRYHVPVRCHTLRSHHPQLSSIQAQPPPTSYFPLLLTTRP
jgi:hypothetical protein